MGSLLKNINHTWIFGIFQWKQILLKNSLYIRDTKGTFHAKMGTMKDRNCMDPTEAEYIKKRWQEYIDELYKKDLSDPDNHDGVITHLETDIWNAKSSGLRKHPYEQS